MRLERSSGHDNAGDTRSETEGRSARNLQKAGDLVGDTESAPASHKLKRASSALKPIIVMPAIYKRLATPALKPIRLVPATNHAAMCAMKPIGIVPQF